MQRPLFHPSQLFRRLHHRCRLPQEDLHPPLPPSPSYSTTPWYAPPSPAPNPHVPSFFSALADAILLSNNSGVPTPSFTPSAALKKLLPELTSSQLIAFLCCDALPQPHPSPSLILSFFQWLPSSTPATQFRHTSQTYLSMAHFLCRASLPSHALPLLRLLVSRKGRDSAASIFESALEASGSLRPPHPLLFDLLLVAYADAGFISDAACIVHLVRNRGLFPVAALSSCTSIIRRLLDIHPSMHPAAAASAWEFYSEILRCGFPANVLTFNALINAFCKRRDLLKARMVFDGISRHGLRPTAASYNTLINGHFKAGDPEGGLRMRQAMEAHATMPDGYTYGALIDGLCKSGRLNDARDLLDEMRGKGLVPGTVPFTSLIHGYCRERRIRDAVHVYDEMLAAGAMPDLITYNALVDGYCKAREVAEAKKLVEQMRDKMGIEPDAITFTAILDGYCKEGDMASAVEVRAQMGSRGLKLDDVAYTALATGFCRSGQLENAERTLREMESQGLLPEPAVYVMLISALCKVGNVKDGFRLLGEMRHKGLVPGVVAYNAIMHGLCKLGQMKNAETLLDAMISARVVPDDITYNILLEGHSKSKHGAVAERLRGEKGMVLDFAVYSSLINEVVKKPKVNNNRG